MEIAKSYMADERFKDAIPYLNNIIKAQDNNSQKPQAYLRLGICYYNLNNTGEALNQYRTLIDQYPNSDEADAALDDVKTISVETGKPNEYVDFMKKAGRSLSSSCPHRILRVLVGEFPFISATNSTRTRMRRSFGQPFVSTASRKRPSSTYPG